MAFGLSFSQPCSAVNSTVGSNTMLLGAAAVTAGIASLIGLLSGQNSNNANPNNTPSGALLIVTKLSPNASKTAGGSTVYFYGANFTGATAVNFDSTILPVGNWSVQNDNTILITSSPSGVEGTTVDVTVKTPFGTSVTSEITKFTYTNNNQLTRKTFGPPMPHKRGK